jgi:murein endopeptidase
VRQSQLKGILIAAILGGVVEAKTAEAAVADTPLSLGYPNAGRLVGGRRFRETPFMVMVPAHANSNVRWALPALLSVLDRASRVVARKYPGSVLELGELSRHDGGPIMSHLSHQNGRDADVGFYISDLDDQPTQAPKFVRFDGAGDGRDDPTVRFDDKRNWAFVRAILEDPHYEVRQIFIYAPLRARLLAYAAKVGAPRDIRSRAAQAMMQPVNALPHDDHFHIRISCPADQVDLGCTDLPLWHAPGSPDEFGPELLAERRRDPTNDQPYALSPYAWGRLSKLWSVELGICHKVDMACTNVDVGPACEDLGDFRLPTPVLPADEMGKPNAPLDGPSLPGERPEDFIEPSVSLSSGADLGLPFSIAAPPTTMASTMLASEARSDAAAEQPRYRSATVDPAFSCDLPSLQIATFPYCAPDDAPNSCEPSVTALIGHPGLSSTVDVTSTKGADRSFVE